MVICENSVWWTIEPSFESAYGENRTSPSRVKAWRRDRDSIGFWNLSAFDDESGAVDDDSNCTRCHRDTDIGRTLFQDEAEAWLAYLGPIPTLGSVAADLEERAETLEGAAFGNVATATAAPHVAALRMIANRIRQL